MDDLVDQLPCGVILFTEAGYITQINATVEDHVGYTAAELEGQPFANLLSLASRLFYQTHIYPLLTLKGRVDEVALTLLSRSNQRTQILLNALCREVDGQRLIYCAYLPLDQRHLFEAELIQARKAAEQARQAVEESEARYRALAAELEERVAERTQELSIANSNLHYLNADLKRSNENLQQFAYVASHDLQEPLRKIQSFSDMLKTQYATELGEGTALLERMQLAASRMSMLIKDLLAFSRISTRQNTSSFVQLSTVINAVLIDLELALQEAHATVVIDQLPPVKGDPSQLGQLFQNLLSNALKFRRTSTDDNPISPRIRITVCQVAADDLPPAVVPARTAGMYHRIDVSDNGIGFDEKYVDRIFQVFQRLHGRSQYAGTGIGLAICAKVVTNHGGAITAHSRPGEGATFSVYLPV
ncbi:PAS domain S-box protein [Fibrisoma montanum]|uniref:histidine kinase n=1 Tax=Fibrisoma montanum TaxID=2305895 RepID=A0A418MCC4_9BACT|nr:ATP-binding protein [Fibrisoma montanum]RIV24033.1 PAS domain S-box protein [Fibrisoma montanum]